VPNRDDKYVAYCTGGYRSTIAASILRKKGFKVQDVVKGFAAISVTAPELTTKGEVRWDGMGWDGERRRERGLK
jgi:predicted sulfurtransferase